MGALESALERPRSYAHYQDADLALQAAVLAHGIAESQPFFDGNKRLALVAMLTFLELNGYRVEAEQLAEERGWPDRFVIALEQALIGGTDRGGYSTASATNDFRRLLDVGLLSQRGRGRNTRYHASDASRRRHSHRCCDEPSRYVTARTVGFTHAQPSAQVTVPILAA